MSVGSFTRLRRWGELVETLEFVKSFGVVLWAFYFVLCGFVWKRLLYGRKEKGGGRGFRSPEGWVDAYTVGDWVHGERFLGQGWRLGGLGWVAATRTVDLVSLR